MSPTSPPGPLALKSFLVCGGEESGERENNLAALIALDQAVFVMWALFVCRDIFPLAHFAAAKYGHIVISKWQTFFSSLLSFFSFSTLTVLQVERKLIKKCLCLLYLRRAASLFSTRAWK